MSFSTPRGKKNRRRPSQAEIDRARLMVRRWWTWFVPCGAMLLLVLALRLDLPFIAVCLLAFPVITIRLVQAWSDYQMIGGMASPAPRELE